MHPPTLTHTDSNVHICANIDDPTWFFLITQQKAFTLDLLFNFLIWISGRSFREERSRECGSASAKGLTGSAPLSFTVQLKTKLTQLPLRITFSVSVERDGSRQRNNKGGGKESRVDKRERKKNMCSKRKSPLR